MLLFIFAAFAYVATQTPTPSQTNLNVKIPTDLLNNLQQDANVYILGTADAANAYVSSTSAFFVSRLDLSRVYGVTSTGSNFKLMVPFHPIKVTLISLNPKSNQICVDTAMNNSGTYGSAVEFKKCTIFQADVKEYTTTIELAIQTNLNQVKQFPVKSS